VGIGGEDGLDPHHRTIASLGGGFLLDLGDQAGDEGAVVLGREVAEGGEGLDFDLVAGGVVALPFGRRSRAGPITSSPALAKRHCGSAGLGLWPLG
jgi:hypothetical protein